MKTLTFPISNSLGATPLHDACRFGDLHVVEALLSAKADLNHKDKYGFLLNYCCGRL